MIHELKTWPEYFEEVFAGRKNFEVRENDRNYQVGDILVLKEFNPEIGEYTGRILKKQISYILNGGQFGIQEGVVILSIINVPTKFIYC